jgi:hypothetical protein
MKYFLFLLIPVMACSSTVSSDGQTDSTKAATVEDTCQKKVQEFACLYDSMHTIRQTDTLYHREDESVPHRLGYVDPLRNTYKIVITTFYIDTTKNSVFHKNIAYSPDDKDKREFTESALYHQNTTGAPFNKSKVTLPKEWVMLYTYKGCYYAYDASVHMYLTDSVLVSYNGMMGVSMVTGFQSAGKNEYIVHLKSRIFTPDSMVSNTCRIQYIDRKKEITQWSLKIWGKDFQGLFIPRHRIGEYPVIINYNPCIKEHFDFRGWD